MKNISLKRFMMAFSILAVLSTAAWADDMSGMAMSTPAVSQPTVQSTPAAKKKSKKAQKKKNTKVVWVCPMGDYSGPQTKDGKCPKCGMNLVKEEVPADSTPTASTGSGGM